MDSSFSPHGALTRMSRTAALERRPGVALLPEDRVVLDEWTGSKAKTNRLIQRLSREGQIIRIRRGAYALPDSTGGFRLDVLDLVDTLTPRPYLVTGGRALEFHDLTDQHFRQVHVLRDCQARSWEWQGSLVEYVKTVSPLKVRPTRTSRTKARIAVPERAIADSLANPGWGVTLSQVTHAISLLLDSDPASADRLAVVAAKLGNRSLARRLGFLVELVATRDVARPFLPLLGSNKAAVPLLAGGPAGGEIDRVWQVRVNLDPTGIVNYSEKP